MRYEKRPAHRTRLARRSKSLGFGDGEAVRYGAAMPTNDTTSAPTRSDERPAQLDLFDAVETTMRSAPNGVTAEAARAAVSPGWWHIVAPYYQRGWGVTVTHCREVDGVLELETSRGPDSARENSLDSWARDAARTTCGCCGSGGAKPFRDFGQPTRIVCARCREQLLAGEKYLAIADRYYTLDGTRRIPPLPLPTAPAESSGPPMIRRGLRPCTTLPPDELRALVRSITASMQITVCGEEDAVASLALLGAIHVGGGLPRGARAPVMGPSGSGKSTCVQALRDALAEWDIAWVFSSVADLSTVGWRGTNLNELLGDAFHGVAPDSLRARRAVVCIDELHYLGAPDLDGVARQKYRELVAAMLSLFGDSTIHLSDGTTEWASREALVLGLGVFPRALAAGRHPTGADLELDALPLELSSRVETIVRLDRLPEPQLVQLLRGWPALRDLTDVCTRLGYAVHVSDEAVRHAARITTLAGDAMTARTAGGWLVSALRRALADALADPDRRELVITPDALPIPPHATRARPDDPQDDFGWGDLTTFP